MQFVLFEVNSAYRQSYNDSRDQRATENNILFIIKNLLNLFVNLYIK